jgi:potassium-transporting ATPase potassium-binding subunit
VLLGTATGAALHDGTPHGFTEIFYAYASATNGNGSAMAGLGADTPWYDTTLGLAMLGGRYLPIVASVALARGRVRPATSGTLPTSGITFGIVLLGVVALVGGLTFLPALVLGPLAEAL